jgi:NAD+ kinase
MTLVVITVHQARPEALRLARDLSAWLIGEGHRVVASADDVAAVGPDAGIEAIDDDQRAMLGNADLVVALGGDGTVLRTVEMLGGLAVPILGVNLGQLGYLTEVEPDEVHGAITRVLAGDHSIECRMLLEVVVDPDGQCRRYLALNEALVDRTLSGHTVRLDVAIDGRGFTPYEVDALIVGTPTGSTAYGYSAGGPIVAPTHRLIVLTPVSPHMLFDRTLVLEASSTVDVTMAGHRPGTLVIDGRAVAELSTGDVVRCTAAAEQAHLVVFGPRDFPGLLKAKFKLSDR